MSGYRDLIAWKKAMDLAEATYKLTAKFPSSERFNLTAQMRGCAISIPSNIAEGHGRGSSNEFRRFLRFALGSARELETQIILSGRLDLHARQPLRDLLKDCVEVSKIIQGLIRANKKKPGDD